MPDLMIMQQLRRFLEESDDDEKDFLSKFSAVMSNILLFFLIFGLSATVEVKNLRHQLTNKFAIITGVAMQFLIMPLLGFVAVMMLRGTGFTEAMGITLLVVTTSPGGSYSNWWCSVFNAELALSVAMTSVSSILSVGLLPANLFLYSWLTYTVIDPPQNGEKVDVIGALDFEAIFITLGVVLGAILIGMYCAYKFDNAKFHARANHFGSICGIALILFSVFLGSGAGGAEANFWSMPWSFYVGVAFPCLVGMTLANIISRSFRLSPPETVAISIECCYQNVAIATSVAVTMFSDPTERAEAVSVPLFYGIVEAVIIGLYCVWAWKMGWTKAPADENICVVISKTYEVHEQDLEDVEFDANTDEIGDHKGWKAKLFEPRSHEDEHLVEEESEGIKETPQDARQRFYSADVTVATTAAPSTPGSPESSLETIPQGKSMSLDSEDVEDVDAPSLCDKVSIIEPVQESIEVMSESQVEDCDLPPMPKREAQESRSVPPGTPDQAAPAETPEVDPDFSNSTVYNA